MNRLLLSCMLLYCTEASAALSVITNVISHSNCGRPNGSASAFASGGVMPYTYQWSGGISSNNSVVGLSPGTYTVTVTDAAMEQASANVVIDLLNGYALNSLQIGAYGIGASHCAGELAQLVCYTGNSLTTPYDPTTAYGPGPYSYALGNGVSSVAPVMRCNDPNGILVFDVIFSDAAPGTQITMNYTDASGCPGTVVTNVPPPFTPPNLQITNITPSCQNGSAGTMTVAVNIVVGGFFGLYIRPAGQTVACVANEAEMLTFQNPFDSGVRTFTGLPPGDHELVWTTDPNGYSQFSQLSPVTACEGVIPFTVPVVAANCGSMTGSLYIDDNANCLLSGENRIANSIVRVDPGPIYLTTDLNGFYSATLPYGSYTITEQHPVFVQSCPAAFTLSSTATQVKNTACAGGVPLDVMVDVASGAARPGFELLYAIYVRNLTPSSTGTVTLSLEVDPVLSFQSSSLTPTTINGTTLTWTAPAFALSLPFQERTIWVRFLVPPDVGLLGTVLQAAASITTANMDGDPSNNTHVHGVEVTGSYDPNDKLASTSLGSSSVWLINEDQWIDYTIRFQNTGTDTAFTVVITDTLPTTLDPASILWGASSHAHSRAFIGQGVLKFTFPNIRLPDSNVNEPRSHGFVSFRIRPHLPVMPGTTIENIANIYFDFNPPVITAPSVLTAVPTVQVDASAFLSGPYDAQTGLMRDLLRAQGLIPLTEPYTSLGYAHTGGGGNESVAPSVLAHSGAEAIVDWVVLELRSAAQPATVLHSRAALLRRDGRVTGMDGTSPVAFVAPAGNYHVSIRHRNHLGVMSAALVNLSATATSFDFTSTGNTVFGTEATGITDNVRVLWPGDTDGSGTVKYVGASNDRDPILLGIGGNTPINVVSGVYSRLDVNLDGQIKYVGAGNDRDPILVAVGSTLPTNVLLQQLP